MADISSSVRQSVGSLRETAAAIGLRIQSDVAAVGSTEPLRYASILMIAGAFLYGDIKLPVVWSSHHRNPVNLLNRSSSQIQSRFATIVADGFGLSFLGIEPCWNREVVTEKGKCL